MQQEQRNRDTLYRSECVPPGAFIMRPTRFIVVAWGIAVAALAEYFVVEHRQLETWVQPLQKRVPTCTGKGIDSGMPLPDPCAVAV